MTSKEIWVLAEVRNGRVARGALQLLGAARGLAVDGAAVAVLVGGDEGIAADLADFAPTVLRLDGPGLATYEATRHAAAIAKLVEKRGAPMAILAPASSTGLELVPRIAALFGTGYLSSCVALSLEGGALAARRPVHGGKAYEDVAFAAVPALLTMNPAFELHSAEYPVRAAAG